MSQQTYSKVAHADSVKQKAPDLACNKPRMFYTVRLQCLPQSHGAGVPGNDS